MNNTVIKGVFNLAFLGLILTVIILLAIWVLLIHFLPHGWWITLINVLGFGITGLFVIGMVRQWFRTIIPSLPSWLSWALCCVIFVGCLFLKSFALSIIR